MTIAQATYNYFKISRVTGVTRVRGAAAREASSDGAKFWCGVVALLALQLAIKISQ